MPEIISSSGSGGVSGGVSSQVTLASWTRLNDLYTLGKITSDQKDVLAAQLEVNDGEVLRFLTMETSDKIVTLAGDLLYERNLAKNIDGGRGNVVVIERPDENDPSHSDDIVIETQHSVLRFSVSRYNRRAVDSNGSSTLHVSGSDSKEGHNSYSRPSSKSIDSPTVSRRAFNAAQYMQRMRSQSQLYSSDLIDDQDGDRDSAFSTHSSICSLDTEDVARISNLDVEDVVEVTSSPHREKRTTKHTSILPTSMIGGKYEEKPSSSLPSSLTKVGSTSSPTTQAPSKANSRNLRPIGLYKTPSARRLKTKKKMLTRLTSFEDDTHVTIAIENDVECFTCDSPLMMGGVGKDIKEGRVSEETEQSDQKKTTVGVFGLSRKLSELWGLSKSEPDSTDGHVVELDADDMYDDSNCVKIDQKDIVISYEDSYSPWASKVRGSDESVSSREDSYTKNDMKQKLSISGSIMGRNSPVVKDNVKKSKDKSKRKSNLSITMGSFKKMFKTDLNRKKEKEITKRRSSVANEFAISNQQLDTLSKVSIINKETEDVQFMTNPIATRKSNDAGVHTSSNSSIDSIPDTASLSTEVKPSIIDVEPLFDVSADRSSSFGSRKSHESLAFTKPEQKAGPPTRQLMENRTIEDYNAEPLESDSDVKAIRVPKRFLSYYLGGCNGASITSQKVLPKRPSNPKKNLPSHKNIQKEVNCIQTDFQSRQLSAQHQTEVAAQLKKHNDDARKILESDPQPETLSLEPALLIPEITVVEVQPPVKRVKNVSFSIVEMRFFTYSTGSGVPSDGGPSLGLHGDFDEADTLRFDLEIFEDFRGGILPEDEEVDEDEEWNDNWRLPREYFVDRGGHLPAKDRMKLLKEAGARRCSIDLSTHLSKLTLSSRLKNARSRVPRLIIEGVDLDEVQMRMQKWEATQTLEPLLIGWAQRWMQKNYPSRYASGK